ncbi:hypothetical protein [Marimonas arenosa]|uniref:Transferase family hexapeptide repeat protein n=1 Tax=Marimonas arenosa TaxID=1795305 RepID=A0AAE3W8H7_9RHOB|nr:hypothetical protein [Marimonas arenosa]MDQ2088576.1 hypothetical protein [Marimonas arenosa]
MAGYKEIERAGFDQGPGVVIGHIVWISSQAAFMRGVTIGNGAIIGAGAAFTREVAPYCIVGDVPAKAIRKRFAPDIVDRLQAVEWSNLDIGQLSGLPVDNVEAAIKRLEAIRAGQGA